MKLRDFDEEELQGIGKRIRAGESFEFDPQEVREVSMVLESVQQMTRKQDLKMFLGGMLWMSPLWILIGVGLALILWKRCAS